MNDTTAAQGAGRAPESPPSETDSKQAPPQSAGLSARDARQWAMLCHLAALSGLLGNGIGFLLGPLVVWLLRREDSPFIDDQGKEAVNFQITMFLALLISAPFVLVLIGIPMLLTIGVIMTVMPVVGAVRASEGQVYRYPLSIRFIR